MGLVLLEFSYLYVYAYCMRLKIDWFVLLEWYAKLISVASCINVIPYVICNEFIMSPAM